jgi:hypothetical protein
MNIFGRRPAVTKGFRREWSGVSERLRNTVLDVLMSLPAEFPGQSTVISCYNNNSAEFKSEFLAMKYLYPPLIISPVRTNSY